jgi:hypothetical protein
MSLFKAKSTGSKHTPPSLTASSGSNPGTERIRSRQPFSAVPLEQRRQGQSHVPLDALLKAYDDYPNLVKDLENTTEQLHITSDEAASAHQRIAQLEQLLQAEKDGRAHDKLEAEETKRLAEKEVDRRVRAELDPKIADLEKRLKETTTQRDEARTEVKERKEEGERWVSALEKMHAESVAQSEREDKVAEERRATAAKGRELQLEILDGLRGVSRVPKSAVKGNGVAGDAKKVDGTGKTSTSTPFGKFTEGGEKVKKRNYDVAD